jgi:hypothetical protein
MINKIMGITNKTEKDDQMTECTARIADIAVEDRFSGSRLAAVENVNRKVIARHTANSILDEWLKAKEQAEKWSLCR